MLTLGFEPGQSGARPVILPSLPGYLSFEPRPDGYNLRPTYPLGNGFSYLGPVLFTRTRDQATINSTASKIINMLTGTVIYGAAGGIATLTALVLYESYTAKKKSVIETLNEAKLPIAGTILSAFLAYKWYTRT